MKNFFRSLKLLKYGLQVRTMLILTIVFFIAGVLMELFLTGTGTDVISGMYLVISGAYIYQLMMTPSASSLVQTSSFRRNLQTKYPMIMTLCTTLFTFTVFVLLRTRRILAMGGKESGEAAAAASKGIFVTAALASLILIYMGVCFKKYILSFVFLIIVAFVLGLTGTIDHLSRLFTFVNCLNYPTLILTSYGVIIAGAILGWLISILCYRMPIDALAIRAALRQAQTK